MKQYKERIQHKCGVPEPEYIDTLIFSKEGAFQQFAAPHAFTAIPFTDIHGDAIQYRCEKSFTIYAVTVKGNGERFYAKSKDKNPALFSCAHTNVHKQLEQHFNL